MWHRPGKELAQSKKYDDDKDYYNYNHDCDDYDYYDYDFDHYDDYNYDDYAQDDGDLRWLCCISLCRQKLLSRKCKDEKKSNEKKDKNKKKKKERKEREEKNRENKLQKKEGKKADKGRGSVNVFVCSLWFGHGLPYKDMTTYPLDLVQGWHLIGWQIRAQ